MPYRFLILLCTERVSVLIHLASGSFSLLYSGDLLLFPPFQSFSISYLELLSVQPLGEPSVNQETQTQRAAARGGWAEGQQR